jgi:1-acyl-sn-glycerol-3-phosphate acyltransferase
MSTATSDWLAAAVLAAVGAVPVMLAIRAARRTEYTFSQRLVMGVNYVVARVLWRAEVVGAMPIPSGQGAIIVCNHRCPLDPAFVALSVSRMVHWMVAREYVFHPLLAWAFRICQVIPVGRAGVDTAATKMAIRYAQSGQLVGLFPEGRINETDQLLLPGRPGAALIALKARVPVVPCYVHGSPYDGTEWGCLFMPAKVRLVIGRPIDLAEYYGRSDRDVLEDLTKRFLKEIAVLAGQDDFEPQLAGRFYKPGLAAEAQ